MKKTPFILPLLIVGMSAIAQENASSVNASTLPTLRKNELSVNIAPALRLLLNTGTSDATRFSMTYKRYLNEKSALRFSLVADLINHDINPNPHDERILVLGDTAVIRQNTITPTYVSPHLNIGYERLFGKNKLKWFYGADLVIGYSMSKTITQNIQLNRDTAQGSTGWVEWVAHPDVVSSKHTEAFSVGVSPFFGVKYPLSKHLSVSAQAGVDFLYRNQIVTEKGVGADKRMHYSTFDFNETGGILNDVSLVYKF